MFIGGNFLFAAAEQIPQAAWVAGQALLIGIGSAGLGIGILLGSVGRMFPAQDPAAMKRRSLLFGLVPAIGQVGQFALAPLARSLIASSGWVYAATVLAWQTLIIVPMILLLRRQTPKSAAPKPAPTEPETDVKTKTDAVPTPAPIPVALVATPGPRYEPVPEPPTAFGAVREGFAHLPVIVLTIAYVSCGWTLGFVTTSMAAALQDKGVSADGAAWCISAIGIGSLFGTLLSGILPAYVKWITAKRFLAVVYFFRGVFLFTIAAMPPNLAGLITVCVLMGFTWFSSIPPTTSLFASICGTRWLGTISSVAFAVHQVGMFLGAYLGKFERDPAPLSEKEGRLLREPS
jgi:MFS family permease